MPFGWLRERVGGEALFGWLRWWVVGGRALLGWVGAFGLVALVGGWW